VIIFTNHSLLKLKQRRIPKEFVIETIEDPDHIQTSYSDRKAKYKKFGRLNLKVVYKNEGNDIVIITQHWVIKIK